jgi:hypothetical protein
VGQLCVLSHGKANVSSYISYFTWVCTAFSLSLIPLGFAAAAKAHARMLTVPLGSSLGLLRTFGVATLAIAIVMFLVTVMSMVAWIGGLVIEDKEQPVPDKKRTVNEDSTLRMLQMGFSESCGVPD